MTRTFFDGPLQFELSKFHCIIQFMSMSVWMLVCVCHSVCQYQKMSHSDQLVNLYKPVNRILENLLQP